MKIIRLTMFMVLNLICHSNLFCRNVDSLKNEFLTANKQIKNALKTQVIQLLGQQYDTADIELQILIYVDPIKKDSFLFSNVRQLGNFQSTKLDSIRSFCMYNDSFLNSVHVLNSYNIEKYNYQDGHYKYNNIVEIVFLNKVAMRRRGMKCED